MRRYVYREWHSDWPTFSIALLARRWGVGFRLRRDPDCWFLWIFVGPWVFAGHRSRNETKEAKP